MSRSEPSVDFDRRVCPRCTAVTGHLTDGRPFCPACLWEGPSPAPSSVTHLPDGLPPDEIARQVWALIVEDVLNRHLRWGQVSIERDHRG